MAERDSQRQKVYDWERSIAEGFYNPDLSLDECRELVKDVWAAYRPLQRTPEIVAGQGARGSSWRITLPHWGRNRRVVLHETAHSLIPPGPAHGPGFVRLYIELLERWAQLPRRQLLDSARAAKIRIGKAQEAERPAARTRARKDLNGPRAHDHNWRHVEVLERKAQRNGLLLLYRARCDICGKEIPS